MDVGAPRARDKADRKLDLSGGQGSFPYSIRDDAIRESLSDQSRNGTVFHHPTALEIETAERVRDLIPAAQHVRFGPTRSEANLAAIRIARASTEKNLIVRIHDQDLGWYNNLTPEVCHSDQPWSGGGHRFATPGSGQTTSDVANLVEVRWGDLLWVERLFQQRSSQIAAMIIQPIHRNLECPPHGYFYCLRSLCDRFGIFLIFDETRHGFHIGPGAAQGYFEVEPDLSTFASSPKDGFSASILCGKVPLLARWSHLGTLFYGAHHGNAIGVAGIQACLTLIEERRHSGDGSLQWGSMPLEKRLLSSPVFARESIGVTRVGDLLGIDLPDSVKEGFAADLIQSGVTLSDDGLFRLGGLDSDEAIEEIAHRIEATIEKAVRIESSHLNSSANPVPTCIKDATDERPASKRVRFTGVDTPDSLSERFREKRFKGLMNLASQFPTKPHRIVDLGGTAEYWVNRGLAGSPDFDITLVNLSPQEESRRNIHFVMRDVGDLSFLEDKAFDIAVCHSVIEHLYTGERQEELSRQIQRIAKAYWVQTPNYWFPVEPHFLLPLFQWLPEWIRIHILNRYGSLRFGPYRDLAMSRQAVKEIRLLARKDLEKLFPGAEITPERYLGWVKSWVVASPQNLEE